MLPEPTPTAGADPRTVPVAVLLPPNRPVPADVLELSVTMLGNAAVEEAASWTVSDAAGGAGAVPAWRRCGVNRMGR